MKQRISSSDYITELRNLSPFGLKMTLFSKLTKHTNRNDVRKVRTYLALAKVAYPDRTISELVEDPALLKQCRKVLEKYYVPNKSWKSGDDKWEVFHKIAEPPSI